MQQANLKSILTEKVTELRLTAELDPETLKPAWEAGIATLNASVDVNTLAAAMQGNIEPLAGKQAVWTPMQSYLVPLGSNRVAFIRPAQRDKASAWLGSNGSMTVSAYLAEQAKQPEQYLSFMLALALKDYFSATRLVSHLQEFESLQGQDLTAVAGLLASVQGVSIIVGRESLSECIVAVEFAQSPTSLQSVADKMFSELLVRHGTPAPEVATWKVAVKANTLSFQGALSEDSLDEVLKYSAPSHAEHVATTVTATYDRLRKRQPRAPQQTQAPVTANWLRSPKPTLIKSTPSLSAFASTKPRLRDFVRNGTKHKPGASPKFQRCMWIVT